MEEATVKIKRLDSGFNSEEEGKLFAFSSAGDVIASLNKFLSNELRHLERDEYLLVKFLKEKK